MTYNQRILLHRLLPVVYWLLALGGSIAVPLGFGLVVPSKYWWGFVPAIFVLMSLAVSKRIDRHEPYVEQMFQIAVFLGVASYWLPTVIVLVVPFTIFGIWKATWNFRAILAIIIALGLVALYAAIFLYFGWIENTWVHAFEPDYAWGWIPLGAIMVAWLATTITRAILKDR